MRRRARSYSSQARGPLAFGREIWNLADAHTRDIDAQVERELERLRAIEEAVREETGLAVQDLDVLDVGAGQLLLPMMYFSHRNRVVGIDQNVIAQGFDPLAYWRMLRANGGVRVLKTLGRKVLGIDRRYRRQFMRSLGLRDVPRLKVLQMDAAALDFASESFDFVYSLLVFPHLSGPSSAAEELARVLRPGGVAYVDFTVYTGASGALDVRALGGRATALPPWAHLRPAFQAEVQESAYLNRLRLPEWQRLFSTIMPGAAGRFFSPDAERYEPEARRLRESGELADYSLEELLTSQAAFIWRKPLAADA